MGLPMPSRGGAGEAGYAVGAVHFDGSTYLGIASLTSTDNEFFSFSLWTKAQGDNTGKTVWNADNENDNMPLAYFVSDGVLRYELCSDNQASVLDARTSQFSNGAWHHILGAARTNLTAGNKIIKLYVNDVDVTASIGDTDASFSSATNGQNFTVGASGVFADGFLGDMAEVWIAPGQSLLTGSEIAEATRRKFISASSKPVDLGADGSTPTGTAPRMFFSGDATTFGTNLGTGGAFTTTGTLTNASTSPSD